MNFSAELSSWCLSFTAGSALAESLSSASTGMHSSHGSRGGEGVVNAASVVERPRACAVLGVEATLTVADERTQGG